MGKLDASLVQYLTKEDFRVLTAIEMGMKNHELVPGPLVAQVAALRSGGVFKKVRELCHHRLVAYERGKHYDGYRLTNKGYDYLALKTLCMREAVFGFGSQIGVGKESDIFVVTGEEEQLLCLKIHRLGRTCFRRLKEKRDYHRGREMSWIYLSRLAATKEFAYMEALHARGFPIPKPIAINRHCIVMELVNGYQLHNIHELNDPGALYHELMELIIRFANNGVIHGDFNEFNIMVTDDDKPIIIDFPQMISTSHENAKMYFERDVQCVVTYFKKKYGYESELYPDFDEDVEKEYALDKEVAASGHKNDIKAFDEIMVMNRIDEGDEEETDDDSEGDQDKEELKQPEIIDVEVTEKNNEEYENKQSDNVKPTKASATDSVQITGDEVIYKDSTFNATMNMYFMSLKNVSDPSENYNICTDENVPSHDAQHEAPTAEMNHFSTANCGDPAETSCGLPTVPETNKDVFDTRSTTSRKSKQRNTGQKMDVETRNALKQRILEARKIRKEAEEKGELAPYLLESLEIAKKDDDRLSGFSFFTGQSSVAASTIKTRMEREFDKIEGKQISKKNLRVKGEANAVTRTKKENEFNIKDSMDCSDVWK